MGGAVLTRLLTLEITGNGIMKGLKKTKVHRVIIRYNCRYLFYILSCNELFENQKRINKNVHVSYDVLFLNVIAWKY